MVVGALPPLRWSIAPYQTRGCGSTAPSQTRGCGITALQMTRGCGSSAFHLMGGVGHGSVRQHNGEPGYLLLGCELQRE